MARHKSVIEIRATSRATCKVKAYFIKTDSKL